MFVTGPKVVEVRFYLALKHAGTYIHIQYIHMEAHIGTHMCIHEHMHTHTCVCEIRLCIYRK